MTLSALIAEVQQQTRWPESAIERIVREAWPDHQHFTPTQAALVVSGIRRREAQR